MDKQIIKNSIYGLIKTMTGNVKPLNDNMPLDESLGFREADFTHLLNLIELNFLFSIDIDLLPNAVSLNQLVDIVVWEVQSAA